MTDPSSEINRRVVLQLMASAGISISSMSLTSLASAKEDINKNADNHSNMNKSKKLTSTSPLLRML